ncbi:MAG: MMPL family transporter [Gaiellaceae bacterium]
MLERLRAMPGGDFLRLLAWIDLVGVLAIIGLGVGGHLHRTEPAVGGTPAAKASAVAERAFGHPSNGLVVLLEGPPKELAVQGPAVARRIASLPHFQVIDPWTARVPQLQPKPSQAVLIVNVSEGFQAASDDAAPRLRKFLHATTRPPLIAHMSGYPDTANAIHSTTVKGVERSELIAAPMLVVVLLLVLGSPIAALLPLFLGGCAVAAGGGVLEIVNRLTPLDASALNLSTMIGLALGVDYSLLLVTRFRSELANGLSVTDASRVAAARAGKTVRFAAAVLAIAMGGALVVVPGGILRSAAVGSLVAVAIGALGATVALPPLLRLVGHDVNRAQLVPAGAQSRRWGDLAMRIVSRPVVAGGLVVAVLLAVSAPTLGLVTGPPNPLTLPKDNAARQDYDAINRDIGDAGSRIVPYTLTAVARGGRFDGPRAQALALFARQLAHDPRTLMALGPATNARGDAVQFLVVKRGHFTFTSSSYRHHVEQMANALGARTNSTVAVGGPGASLADFDNAAQSRLPLLIVVLLSITYVALVPILRSLILPLIAVVLNMLTVLAAFGVLALAFGPSHPLGGPGFVDDIMVDVVFSIVLALSIDYEIFLLDRMREGHALTGTVEGAISYGLEHTAGVITGAAAIMTAVFLAFAISPVITMRQLGVGLTVAVVLDATLVRLVLLPAALRLAGPAAWRLPHPVARLMPGQPAPERT